MPVSPTPPYTIAKDMVHVHRAEYGANSSFVLQPFTHSRQARNAPQVCSSSCSSADGEIRACSLREAHYSDVTNDQGSKGAQRDESWRGGWLSGGIGPRAKGSPNCTEPQISVRSMRAQQLALHGRSRFPPQTG